MRAVPLYATIGSLVLSALTAAPATAWDGPGPASAEARGTAVAAARAAAAGISFGACPEEEMLPDTLKCGTVSVPLDYARPDGPAVELAVSRTLATGPAAGRQGSFVYNPGGPGASSITFPLMGEMSEWKEVAAAYDHGRTPPRPPSTP
ncbi:alpha/beta hydrolase, partial [Streptomyces sp. MBT58]|nr:alpha/beta hydrolase [Streptomyces sp. MBT58]